MPLFSRRPSREAALQKIYTEAYQLSLQSILKESSFELPSALDAWKTTLAQITAGMAQLDGSPPRTGQEKSLLGSIMDIERQCHDRIAALENRLSQTGGSSTSRPLPQSPYGTHATNASTVNVSELSLSEKRKPTRVAVGAKADKAEVPSNSSGSSVYAAPIGNLASGVGHLPKVSDMPYKLYTQKSNRSSYATSSITSTKSATSPVVPPHANSSPHIRSASTGQASEGGHPSSSHPHSAHSSGGHSGSSSSLTSSGKASASSANVRSTPLLASLSGALSGASVANAKQAQKAKEPQHRSSLDYPQPAPAQHSHSMLTTLRSKNPLKSRQRSSPSPRSSGENIATKESEDLVKKHALVAAKQSTAKTESPTLPAANQFSGFEGAFRSDSQPSSPNPESPQDVQFSSPPIIPQHPQQPTAPPSQPPQAQKKSPQFQVTYEQVASSTGRPVYRPRVVRSGPVPTHSPAAPAAPSNSRPASQPQQSQPQQQPSSQRMLADGSPESNAGNTSLDEMDEWDRMAREKVDNLRGVDKQAAEQILNEIVLKGDKVNWDDIAGLEKAKASLKETVVYPFLRPDLFMGLREPVLGMLLFGPPGTGKTMLARAVATESKSTFFSISASSLTSKYMGESEKLVRALFQIAKALAPSIIFVDEIDSILTQRQDSGEHEASRRIKNEFLVQWSDLQAAATGKLSDDSNVRRVLVLGATNLPWAIDEAARRRFVRRQYIPLPEPYTRRVHIEKLLSHQKHGLTPEDINELVRITNGYSGSDMTALAKDAAMGPLRALGDALLTTAPDQIRPMGMNDFVDSMRSIRPSVSAEGLRAFEQWADMYGSSGA